MSVRAHFTLWTEEEISILSEFRAERWTYAQIAKHLGRTTDSVAQRANALGLYGGRYPAKRVLAKSRFWTPDEIAFLKDRHHRWGMTSREIAEAMGRDMRSVQVKMYELGLTPNNCGSAAADHIGSNLKGVSAAAEIRRMEATAMLEARIAARRRRGF